MGEEEKEKVKDPTISPSVTIAWCMGAEDIIVTRMIVKFMKPFQM